MNRRFAWTAVAAVALAAAGYGLYWIGMSQGMKMASPAQPAAKADEGRKVLYWHDPMVPGQKFDKPGKSPFMDMDLVPVYADEAADAGGVTISPRVQQNLGIRTAEATRGEIGMKVEAVGTVAWNERDVAVVQARATGFVEKLHVRAALDPVRRGQPLAELYVPEWVAAQEEYLAALRMGGPGLDALREGALQRMRLAGMDERQVKLVESTGRAHPRLTLVAPIDGVVAELSVREGMTAMAGAPLFRINGLSTVWVNAEVPEALASRVRPGVAVEARAAAVPGRTFGGKVDAILPEVNPTTRTIKARVVLDNRGRALVPGMFATVSFAPAAKREAVLVPSEAVIRTGRRAVVIVAGESAGGTQRFRPVEVEPGAESGGMTEIRGGIQPGQRVVASGQFLIDSEASLKAFTDRLGVEPGQAAETQPGRSGDAAGTEHRAEGKVEEVGGDAVTLSHEPVPSLKWPAMTMEFKAPRGGWPKDLGPGTAIEFGFVQTPQGEFEVTGVRRRGAAKADPHAGHK
jgi:Cu(I)/Ag(I) efflux system membrane fusion protein